MDENDEQVRTLSQVEERELHLQRVTELMGLRGHLQDELLRIEAMLAEDDPELAVCICYHCMASLKFSSCSVWGNSKETMGELCKFCETSKPRRTFSALWPFR
jgi:hypothetical protein